MWALAIAQTVFDNRLVREVLFWNTWLAEYAEYKDGQDVLKQSELMQSQSVSPDAVTYDCGLKVGSPLQNTHDAREVHYHIGKMVKTFETKPFGANKVLCMHAKCSSIATQEVSNEHLAQDVNTRRHSFQSMQSMSLKH